MASRPPRAVERSLERTRGPRCATDADWNGAAASVRAAEHRQRSALTRWPVRPDRLPTRHDRRSRQGAAAARNPRAFPELPWSAMSRTRDGITHHYFRINRDIIWDTATKTFLKWNARLPSHWPPWQSGSRSTQHRRRPLTSLRHAQHGPDPLTLFLALRSPSKASGSLATGIGTRYEA